MNHRTVSAVAVVLVAATAALTGCSHSSSAGSATGRPRLHVSGAYVPRPPLTDMATGYFTVTNTGSAADALTGVTSDLAPMVSLHVTTDTDAMKGVSSLPIPAHGSLVLKTGGNHLMLMNLTERPAVGRQVTFHLRFAHSGPVTVKAPVEPATYQPKS
ncbi:copper chaperone PCu(A)C [Streptomyces sp. NBC_00448]|uniref:copper chaperone PCu(A)C n=1 Tax=Streptomyces sp. NBC_00448 TaxID=2903652 RepID=UPI002E1A9925